MGPDHQVEYRILRQLGFTAEDAQGILEEIYVPGQVAQAVRQAVSPTLKMFEATSVFSISAVEQAFCIGMEIRLICLSVLLALPPVQSTKTKRFPGGKCSLALQFHPEVTARGLERWFIGHACEISATSDVNIAKLREDTANYAKQLEIQGC